MYLRDDSANVKRKAAVGKRVVRTLFENSNVCRLIQSLQSNLYYPGIPKPSRSATTSSNASYDNNLATLGESPAYYSLLQISTKRNA